MSGWDKHPAGGRIAAILLAFAIGLALMSMVPPFQSPDEPAHIARAYLLAKGQLVLDTPPGFDSGGRVDDGLIAFSAAHDMLRFAPHRKLTQAEQTAASRIMWAGTRSFIAAPGTGYYFPLAYLPQAAGLATGEALGLTVAHSYFLARVFSLGLSLLAIALAFAVFPVNLFSFAVLVLPMSIFQFVSASLDGFTMALGVLAVSLFMRGAGKEKDFPAWMSYAMALAILLLATSRTNLLPLLAMPLVVFAMRRSPREFWIFLAVGLLAVAWTVLAFKLTQLTRPARPPAGEIVAYYLTHPPALGEVLANTLGDSHLQKMYLASFVGILGWLDTPLPVWFYKVAAGCLAIAAALSLSLRRIGACWQPSAALVLMSLGSALLTFLALLVGWSPHPATLVEGVQGRYFTIPLILLGYAMYGAGAADGRNLKYGAPLFLAYFCVVLYVMPNTLVKRYFMATAEGFPAIVAGRATTPGQPGDDREILLCRVPA